MEYLEKDDVLNNSQKTIINQMIEASPTSTTYPNSSFQVPIIPGLVDTVQAQIIHQPFFDEACSSSQIVQYFVPSIAPGSSTTLEPISIESERFAEGSMQLPEFEPIKTVQQSIIPELVDTVQAQSIHQPYFEEASSSSRNVQYFMPLIEPGSFTTLEPIYIESELFAQCLFQLSKFEPIQTVQQPIIPELVGTVQTQIIHQPYFEEACSSSQIVQYFVPSVKPGSFITLEPISIKSERFAEGSMQLPEFEPIETVQQSIIPELADTLQAQSIHQPLFDEASSSSQNVQYFIPPIESGSFTTLEPPSIESELFVKCSLQLPELEPIETVQQSITPELVDTVQEESIHQPYFDETSSSSQNVQYFTPPIEPGPSTTVEESFTDPKQFVQYVKGLLDQQWEVLSQKIIEPQAQDTTNIKKRTFYITVVEEQVLYICEQCNCTFPWVNQLIDHKKEIHSIFICQTCCKYFNGIEQYNNHLEWHRVTNDIKCRICGILFVRIYHLIEHLQNHLNPTWYVCKLCGYNTTLKSRFLNHESFHTCDEPFGCIRCKNTFKSISSAGEHFSHTCRFSRKDFKIR